MSAAPTPLYFKMVIVIMIISFFSCQQDSELSSGSATYPLADQRLWSHFQNFEQEAKKRGYTIDLRKMEITGSITEIAEEGVAGTCRYGQYTHAVTVDQSYWNNVGSLRREMVVFHELGHCALFLGHSENANDENLCLSIMNSGTSGCSVAYSSVNREYYLDELFGQID